MSIRSTILACLTALAMIAVLIAFIHKNTRYELVGTQNGVYILDKKTTLMHHCDQEKCKLLTPDGTTIQDMRAMAGIPNVDLVRKPEPPVCVPQEQKAPEQIRSVNITSFQSIHDPLPVANLAPSHNGQALGMETVQQQVQKPYNPFPTNGTQIPQQNNNQNISQGLPQEQVQNVNENGMVQQQDQGNMQYQTNTNDSMMSPPVTQVNYTPTQNTQAAPLQAQATDMNDYYGGSAASSGNSGDLNQQQVQAMDNPFGQAASGTGNVDSVQQQVQEMNNPYGQVASGVPQDDSYYQ